MQTFVCISMLMFLSWASWTPPLLREHDFSSLLALPCSHHIVLSPCPPRWMCYCIITSLELHQGDKWTAAFFPPRHPLHPLMALPDVDHRPEGRLWGGWWWGGLSVSRGGDGCGWHCIAAITEPFIPNVTWMCAVSQHGAGSSSAPCLSSTHPDFLRHCNQSASLWSVIRWCICTGPRLAVPDEMYIQRWSCASELMERAQRTFIDSSCTLVQVVKLGLDYHWRQGFHNLPSSFPR